MGRLAGKNFRVLWRDRHAGLRPSVVAGLNLSSSSKLYSPSRSSPSPPPQTSASGRRDSLVPRPKRSIRARQALLDSVDNIGTASGPVSFSSSSEGDQDPVPRRSSFSIKRRESRSHQARVRPNSSGSARSSIVLDSPLGRPHERFDRYTELGVAPGGLGLLASGSQSANSRRNGRPRSSRSPAPQVHPQLTSIKSRSYASWELREESGNFRRGVESILLCVPMALLAFRFHGPESEIVKKQLFSLGASSTFALLCLRLLSSVYVKRAEMVDYDHASNQSSPLLKDSHRFHESSPHIRRPSIPASHQHCSHWMFMTDSRNYRSNPDDGSLTALFLGPIVAASMLYQTRRIKEKLDDAPPTSFLSSVWLIESPLTTIMTPSPLNALSKSRHALLQLTTLCSFILLLHLIASRLRLINFARASRGDTIPRSEIRRTFLYCSVMFPITSSLFAIRWILYHRYGAPDLWPDLSNFELVTISICYQFAMYLLIRLAQGGFTLGEVGIVAQGGTALFMETIHLTIFRIWPQSTSFIKTFRTPGPLLVFQLALIPGALFTGLLLSPLLVLSRFIARKPSKRLRFPHQKGLQRRALAGGFYVGVALVVFGVIGTWTKWCLGGRNPWLWVIYYLGEGKTPWSRVGLIFYWGVTVLISVIGWSSQLTRVGRRRLLNSSVSSSGALRTPGTAPRSDGDDETTKISSSGVTTDLLDAANRRVPLLSLNGRRKFFHGLAVVMFAPGIVFDPAFTHLAFSVAFSVFIFAEYVRYFAIYPFGAAVHVFLSEFLDEKDSGSAVLSHFYLLTGCAGPLWLESPSSLLDLTGVLVLGVGDALASIVGKRFGRHRWTRGSMKTVEGSGAFTVSVLGCALFLRALGLVETFSVFKYFIGATLGALLEAFSMQNDNAVLPFYMWSLLIWVNTNIGLNALMKGSDNDEHSLTRPGLPSFISHQYFAVAPYDQIAGDGFTTAPSHIKPPPSLPSSSSPILDHRDVLAPATEPVHRSPDDFKTDEADESATPSSSGTDSYSDLVLTSETETEETVSWSTFIESYSEGKWDPMRPPPLPRSDGPFTTSIRQKSLSTPSILLPPYLTPPTRPVVRKNLSDIQESKRSLRPPAVGRAQSSPDAKSISQRRGGESMVLLNNDQRSLPAIPRPAPRSCSESPQPSTPPSFKSAHPSALTDAATVRWAGANAKVAPLALSSPERELLDPLHNFVSGIPTPLAHEQMDTKWTPDSESVPEDLSAPTAEALSPILEASSSGSSADFLSPPDGDFDSFTCDLPVIGRSVGDSTSFLAPPVTTSFGPRIDAVVDGAITQTTSSSSHIPLMSTREEALYLDKGFLPAPLPPNESERRKALHKFNILHTAPDVNFDRIAHLAKLVFNTKWVFISLIDDQEQFFKHASGLDLNSVDRDMAICSHAILQEDDALVVLDTMKDWRFAKNPVVQEKLQVRFYAGSPLRTADGYNIGSMCVVDDQPRTEFTPRQRHTLKEFSAIAMRELELWRDKVQLRIRDRIQTSMEHFTRECLEMDGPEPEGLAPEENMKKVYESASRLVKRTLDLEGAIVTDVSNFEVLPTVVGDNATKGKRYHGNLFEAGGHVSPFSTPRATDIEDGGDIVGDQRHEYGKIPALPVLGSEESGTPSPSRNTPLSGQDHAKLANFLANNPDGKMYERVVPSCFRGMIPPNAQYAMVVPIFNVDGRPFILLCAYTSDRTKHFLEGYELQFLRAIGVIILSAVLKRRMMLADKAKSLFISNNVLSISHELRTPLHGILAAAELLADTGLSLTQNSFLQTVQACGTSLVETVNHVLDFSKLSGNTKTGAMKRTSVDLVSLLEETVEGSWIGSRARAVYGASEIGSAYSPPKRPTADVHAPATDGSPGGAAVETVLDIGHRAQGWFLKCEKGGIRRVLMNLMGNSLKFTSSGFVHITLRELPTEPDASTVRFELAVIDSGKGISKDFLKNQLFHPFSQENPLQTGTGLGLAIVNSIVKSDGINGKADVWSSEGAGTEIRVTIEAEVPARSAKSERPEATYATDEPLEAAQLMLLGFDPLLSGQKLLRDVLSSYFVDWWKAIVTEDRNESNILVVNEDIGVLIDLTQRQDIKRPVILLTTSRGDEQLASTIESFEKIGGFCRVVFKPCRPSHLLSAVKDCVDAITRNPQSSFDSTPTRLNRPPPQQRLSMFSDEDEVHYEGNRQVPYPVLTNGIPPSHSVPSTLARHPAPPRRRSDELPTLMKRPVMTKRSATHASNFFRPFPTLTTAIKAAVRDEPQGTTHLPDGSSVVLKSARGTFSNHKEDRTPPRVLVVEDNHVNRALLVQWLRKKEYQFEEAINGQQALDIFSSKPPGYFQVILIDMSMPVLDGAGATELIRDVEKKRITAEEPPVVEPDSTANASSLQRTQIFALSGLASHDDKLRAFNAGVDGYLVKPVSFKTLATLFARLEDS